MAWRTYPCYVCSGNKQIEIGRNIDDVKEKLEICPICQGKGYLHVIHNPALPSTAYFWTRMTGNNGTSKTDNK